MFCSALIPFSRKEIYCQKLKIVLGQMWPINHCGHLKNSKDHSVFAASESVLAVKIIKT